MANFTKKAIKETFISMLEEHPLSEITVKELVKECEINRNSFYYHYQDIPTLIEEIVKLVDSDLNGIVTRLKATVDVSKKYRNFSGISDDMDGQVKFIYRTDEIKSK